MRNTHRISKAAPIFSYLPRFIKIVRADFERSAIIPKHPLINYPPLDRLLHKTPRNRFSVLVLSHFQTFIFIPLVLSSPVTITEYRVQNTEYKRHFLKTLFRTLGTSKRKDSSKSQHRFFSRWQYFPYRESIDPIPVYTFIKLKKKNLLKLRKTMDVLKASDSFLPYVAMSLQRLDLLLIKKTDIC